MNKKLNAISRQHTVWCETCAEWDQITGHETRQAAARAAIVRGWSYDTKDGWRCPSCTTEAGGFKYEVGKTYMTQSGKHVKVLGREGTKGYECVRCSDGIYRYDRSTGHYDAGRVTNSDHDYSDPENFAR